MIRSKKHIFRLATLGILITSLSNVNAQSLLEPKQRKIAPPSIVNIVNSKLARNDILIIEGSGFINNYPKAHIVHLKPSPKQNSQSDSKTKINKAKKKKPKKKSKLIKLKVIETKPNLLKAKLPEDLNYGDYELLVKIKTNFFKSRLGTSDTQVQIRPIAPPKPKLKFNVISASEQINSLLEESDLIIDKEQLSLGTNEIRTYYIEDGFESLRSQAEIFYYLPESEIKNELEISSDEPLEAYAVEKDLNKIDVSEVTQNENKDLEQNYFLITPNNPHYLLHQKILKALYINKIHVTSDEFVILSNRSSQELNLSNCYFADDIKKRYELAADTIIDAKSELKIEANLGLNDTTEDSLSLYCPSGQITGNISKNLKFLSEEASDSESFELIDIFKYKKLDEDGFGIKEK